MTAYGYPLGADTALMLTRMYVSTIPIATTGGDVALKW